MTDCLAYACTPPGAKQMEIVQAEAESGKDVLHNVVFVKRNNWMSFFFSSTFDVWILNWRGKNNAELIAVSYINLDSIEMRIHLQLVQPSKWIS